MADENVPISSAVDIRTGQPYIEPTNVPLDASAEFGGGGGGGAIDPSVSMKDYIDARDDAVESRLGAKLDKLPTKGQMWAMVATVLGGIATLLTLGLAILSFGGDRFDGGVSVGPRLEAARAAQAEVDASQNAQMSLTDDKLDLIIRQTANLQ